MMKVVRTVSGQESRSVGRIFADLDCVERNVGDVFVPQRMCVDGKLLDPQPLLVLRKATREEYLAQYPYDESVFWGLPNLDTEPVMFYELSSD